jgi:hypothetical protein
MGGIGKSLAQIGASFIPGVGPLISGAIGGLASSGNQGGQNTTMNQNISKNGMQEAIEPDYFSDFRKGLIPMFNNLVEEAKQPTYTDAERADIYGRANENYDASLGNAKNALARMGGLRSGVADTMAGDLAMGRAGQLTDFEMKLPAMERDARFGKLSNLMGLGAQWSGRAPISYKTTENSKVTGNSQTQVDGGPWWKNMLGGAAGGLGRTGWSPKFGGNGGGGDYIGTSEEWG